MTVKERRDHWRALIKKHAQSGLSGAAFCKKKRLTHSNSITGAGVSVARVRPPSSSALFVIPVNAVIRQFVVLLVIQTLWCTPATPFSLCCNRTGLPEVEDFLDVVDQAIEHPLDVYLE